MLPVSGRRPAGAALRTSSPAVVVHHQYTDYWGTRVLGFEVLDAAPRADHHRDAASSRCWRAASGAPASAGPSWLRVVAAARASTSSSSADPADRAARTAGRARRGDARGRPATTRATPRSRSATAVGDAMEYVSGRDRRAHDGRRGVGGDARASARTSRTSPSARCGRSASRRATCPGTCTRGRTPRSARPSSGESHAWVEWFCGDLARLRPDQPDRRSATGTCASATAATTRMWRRCAGCTPGRRASELFVSVAITREA